MEKLKALYNVDNRFITNANYTHIIQQKKHFVNVKDKQSKRLMYVRYANDFIIGLDASKESAMLVYENVTKFLKKTFNFNVNNSIKILYYRTEKPMFLGVELKVDSMVLVSAIKYFNHKASSPTRPLLIIPIEKLRMLLVEYKLLKK